MVKPTSLKLDGDLKERVQSLANTRRRSSHWLMLEAIEQYVDREEKKESFRQDTIRALEEYQATGLHASHEAIDKWLASWGTEHEEPAPVCRK